MLLMHQLHYISTIAVLMAMISIYFEIVSSGILSLPLVNNQM